MAAQQVFTTLLTAIPLLLRTTDIYLLAISPVPLLQPYKDHGLRSKEVEIQFQKRLVLKYNLVIVTSNNFSFASSQGSQQGIFYNLRYSTSLILSYNNPHLFRLTLASVSLFSLIAVFVTLIEVFYLKDKGKHTDLVE